MCVLNMGLPAIFVSGESGESCQAKSAEDMPLAITKPAVTILVYPGWSLKVIVNVEACMRCMHGVDWQQ